METEKRNRLIAGISVGLVALVAIFFLVRSYIKKDPATGEITFGDPKKPAWNRTEALQLMSRLTQFADSVGVDTSRYSLSGAATEPEVDKKFRQLLAELRYGQKVTGLMQNPFEEKIDTVWVGSIELKPELVDSLHRTSEFAPYRQLVEHYGRLKRTAGGDTLKQIQKTLNFYRWLNRYELDRFAVVNIPAAELNVFDRTGKRLMPMEVIAGSLDNKTPLFTSYVTDIIAYPYWNVPDGIAQTELLPRIQRNVGFIDNQNLEVLDKKSGKVLDPYSIDWASVSSDNFPYRIRQTSGCHNSLGLIKFNLNGPGAIYFHDTNSRSLFTATTDRWRSHGCVRLEKPVELANYMLEAVKFDEGFYNRCLIDQKPSTFPLPKKFPVVVIYNLADVNQQGQLVFYKDVYKMKV
ncbi:L,D-transpeptidase family protein [Tellurirhabdus rosea]|uniref:L,D-transpeptidase family protein n=1 Tax=Tellurirhabdus rosea TaxID=2674997 RepID=UPI00224E8B76|nr:L,D-transpeptidase family protein [Tellurirhabdus rosea]